MCFVFVNSVIWDQEWEVYKLENPTLKDGDGSIMLWDSLAALHRIDGFWGKNILTKTLDINHEVNVLAQMSQPNGQWDNGFMAFNYS